MKSLFNYIRDINISTELNEASLLEANLDVTDEEAIESARFIIRSFIFDNYKTNNLHPIISDKPNKDGKFEVSSKYNIEVKNRNITSLTNDLFVWDIVLGNFDCSYSYSLTNLEGAPKKVGGDFNCSGCSSLQSLKDAPKKVGGDFNCSDCSSLQSLEGAPTNVWEFDCSKCNSLTVLKGAPKIVKGGFYCFDCSSLQSLEGAPKKVGVDFNCSKCNSLTSLKGAPEIIKDDFKCYDCSSLQSIEGAPKEVGGDFSCYRCKVNFKESDVRAVSNVKGEITV